MAIDSALRRRAVAGLSGWPIHPSVTPDATPGIEWRQQVGWGYSGIAAGEATVVAVFLYDEGHVNDFYNFCSAITPSDSADHSYVFDAIYVGVAGNISVTPDGAGPAVVFVGLPAGYILRVQGKRVNSTNTTATSLVALKRH